MTINRQGLIFVFSEDEKKHYPLLLFCCFGPLVPRNLGCRSLEIVVIRINHGTLAGKEGMGKKWHVHYSFNVMSDELLCCLDQRLQAVLESFLQGWSIV